MPDHIVLFDPLLLVLVAAVLGLLLWVYTNWHLRRTGLAIKADIDLKRASTEEFVKAELAALKADLGGGEEGGGVAELKAHVQSLDVAMGAHIDALKADMKALPAAMTKAMYLAQGREMKALYSEATEAEGEVEQYVVDEMDPVSLAVMKVDSINPSEKYREEHALGAGIIDVGKELFKGWLNERRDVVTMKPVSGGGKRKGFR